jgi:hypothetical protein
MDRDRSFMAALEELLSALLGAADPRDRIVSVEDATNAS